MSTSLLWSSTTAQNRCVFALGFTRGREAGACRHTGTDLLQFRKKYSWDESAFSSGRDGTDGDAPACKCTTDQHPHGSLVSGEATI